jgi:tetratricopeptide (TPR) repeat protein
MNGTRDNDLANWPPFLMKSRITIAGRLGSLVIATAVLATFLAGQAAAQVPGRLILVNGPGVSGDIVAVSPMGVEIDVRGEAKKVPIETIREVTFAAEPQSLKAARIAIMRGQAAQALEDLAKMEQEEMEGAEQLIVDELEFAKAAAIGGQAAASGENLAAGEKAVRDYLGKHAQSHHAFPMQELLAKLLARGGKFADAAATLAPLDRGPPAYRVRAATARAGLAYEQKKYDEALQEFSAAAKIPTDPQDTASAAQKRAAELGAARCLARQGKGADAVAAVERIVGELDPDDVELLGQAYNVLGDAQRSIGKDQDAIIAFLTVSMVYNSVGADRAEALYNLAQLWERAKSPQRAEEARQELASAYPDSEWTRKLAAGGGS